jgi:hypothetical protein
MNCDESCFYIEQALFSVGTKDPQKLTVVLVFVFRNPSALSAYVIDVPFKVEVAGNQIGQGRLLGLPLLIVGNGRTEAMGMIQLPFSDVPTVAYNAIRQYLKEGALRYRILGTVTFKATFLGMMVPFIPSVTRDFEWRGTLP